MRYMYEEYESVAKSPRDWDDLSNEAYREELVESGELSPEEEGFLKGVYEGT